MAAAPPHSVQCFGRKKTAVAVTHCKAGRGLINGVPIELVQQEILRYKAFEPILLLGRHKFAGVFLFLILARFHFFCVLDFAGVFLFLIRVSSSSSVFLILARFHFFCVLDFG